jgi:hypothetical protein
MAFLLTLTRVYRSRSLSNPARTACQNKRWTKNLQPNVDDHSLIFLFLIGDSIFLHMQSMHLIMHPWAIQNCHVSLNLPPMQDVQVISGLHVFSNRFFHAAESFSTSVKKLPYIVYSFFLTLAIPFRLCTLEWRPAQDHERFSFLRVFSYCLFIYRQHTTTIFQNW